MPTDRLGVDCEEGEVPELPGVVPWDWFFGSGVLTSGVAAGRGVTIPSPNGDPFLLALFIITDEDENEDSEFDGGVVVVAVSFELSSARP